LPVRLKKAASLAEQNADNAAASSMIMIAGKCSVKNDTCVYCDASGKNWNSHTIDTETV